MPHHPLLLVSFFLLACLHDISYKLDNVFAHGLNPNQMGSNIVTEVDANLIPEIPPSNAPYPFVPMLAPSPMVSPFHGIIPKLSGQCSLNVSAIDSLINTTAVDCYNSFAPFLANVICCPQFQATLTILIGQSSKDTGLLAMEPIHANYCLSDIQQMLGSHGATGDIQDICSIYPSNLTEGSCPVNDTYSFESVVDSSMLLAACGKVDPVNECCSQICQTAINEAARNIALKDGGLTTSMGINSFSSEHVSKIDSCKSIVLRWLSSRLSPSTASQVLRGLSNCKVNKACPLTFPDISAVAKDCGDKINNNTLCCHAMRTYVSYLQQQSFITNLQALDCASLLGLQLQKMNVSSNIYSSCQIMLKDFSLQAGSQESGCLLSSLPSDATFDPISGISFTCDLNDNIAAPWPSVSQEPSSSCNKSVNFPALPAATSAYIGCNEFNMKILIFISLLSLLMLRY